MIELLVLFLGVYGTLAAPHVSHMNHDLRHVENNAEIVDSQLRGTANLEEKALPIARLFTGTRNLEERPQVSQLNHQRLPGIENLAEKRIPDAVLKRLRSSDVKLKKFDIE